MDYIIREIYKEEYDLLNDFLYEAIYIPILQCANIHIIHRKMTNC